MSFLWEVAAVSPRWASALVPVSVEHGTLAPVSAVQLVLRRSRVDGARPNIVTRGFEFVTVSRRYPSPCMWFERAWGLTRLDE